MKILSEHSDLSGRQTFAQWLVVFLCLFPMILPVFATLSANQDVVAIDENRMAALNDLKTARPLKGEVVDNEASIPEAPDARGSFIEAAPDVFLAAFAVSGIAFLGWRFTLRYHLRQIK